MEESSFNRMRQYLIKKKKQYYKKGFQEEHVEKNVGDIIDVIYEETDKKLNADESVHSI